MFRKVRVIVVRDLGRGIWEGRYRNVAGEVKRRYGKLKSDSERWII